MSMPMPILSFHVSIFLSGGHFVSSVQFSMFMVHVNLRYSSCNCHFGRALG